MDYKHYIVEDFVLDESFRNYVLKKDPLDEQFWETWIEKHPEKRLEFDEAKQIIRGFDFEEIKINEEELEKGFEEIAEFFDK